MSMTPEEERLYKEAKKKVRRLRNFYSHLAMYIAMSTFLTFVNWFSLAGVLVCSSMGSVFSSATYFSTMNGKNAKFKKRWRK